MYVLNALPVPELKVVASVIVVYHIDLLGLGSSGDILRYLSGSFLHIDLDSQRHA